MTQARNIADAESRFVNVSGDTMSGPLTLSGDPSTNLQAATKQYVDTGLGGKVSLSGSYSDPSWIASLSGTKLTGTVVATNGVVTTGSYSNPSWITSLAGSKLTANSVDVGQLASTIDLGVLP